MLGKTKEPGARASSTLFKLLMVDKKWSVRRDRGFTWWSGDLAQHVEAGPLMAAEDGDRACVMRVSTDVVTEVSDPAGAVAACGTANQSQSLSSYVVDLERNVIESVSTGLVWLNSSEADYYVLATAAILQNVAAGMAASHLAEAAGGQRWTTSHPRSGRRGDTDEILNVASRMAKQGDSPSAFAGDLVEKLEEMDLPSWVDADGDGSGFTVKVMPEAEPNGPAGTGDGALIQVRTDQDHPVLGSGALVTLRFPIGLEEGAENVKINALNRWESAPDSEDVHHSMLGTWCRDPADPSAPMFRSFVPSTLAGPSMLENLLVYNTLRVELAHAVFDATAG